MSYAKEIYKLIVSYLPLTGIELGQVLPIISVEKDANKILLELGNDDYAFIQDQITDESNYSYTASNFRLKNRVVSISLHPSGGSSYFGFLVKFERMLNKNANHDITLAGFASSSYNTSYKIARKEDDYTFILVPNNDLTIALPTGDYGFYSMVNPSGLNGLKTIVDEGDNIVSFTLEENSLSAITTVADLDLTTMPNLWFYQDSILAMNLTTFLKNLTDADNIEYLIIDTTSFAGTPIRSKSNNTDAPYDSYSTNAYFKRSYTLNLAYILQRSVDDSDNNTKTGSDIESKQIAMFDALTAVLRRPIPSDGKKLISSITITEDAPDTVIMEGSVVIFYRLSFTINYLPDSILDLSDDGAYKINQVNYNSDEIVVG